MIGLKRKISVSIAIIIIILFFVVIMKEIKSEHQPSLVHVNPYEQYELILQQPTVGTQISAFVHDIQSLTVLSGWKIMSAKYNGQTGEIILNSSGGRATGLIAKAQSLNMVTKFSSQGATVDFSTVLPKRSASDSMRRIHETQLLLIKRLTTVLPRQAIELHNTNTNPVFQEVGITITFQHLSAADLTLIAHDLDDLPVNLNLISVNINDKLFSGSMNISLVGN